MRAIRQSGSEGGAAGVTTGRPYPYQRPLPEVPAFATPSQGSPGDAGQAPSELGGELAGTLSLFLGGPTGPAATAVTRTPTFSAAVGGAAPLGDVNGDGYADLAKGSSIYLGSATGPVPTPTTLFGGAQGGRR